MPLPPEVLLEEFPLLDLDVRRAARLHERRGVQICHEHRAAHAEEPQQSPVFVQRPLHRSHRRTGEPGARGQVDGRRVGGVQRDDPGHDVRHRGRGRGQVVAGGEAGPALVDADLRRHPFFLPPGTDKNAWSSGAARR